MRLIQRTTSKAPRSRASKSTLGTEHEIYVNGAPAWSEFQWDFHATLRKDGSAVTTHGVETQIYRKEEGKWRLVHVPCSEDRQSTP